VPALIGKTSDSPLVVPWSLVAETTTLMVRQVSAARLV
jgi:hypothetical protein